MKRVLVAILRFYKRNISPLLPNACIYTPTCSEYAMEAIEKHGVFKGLGLAIWRVLRCNPFAKGGYDPVPEPKKHKESIS
ncbi:MAG: membrane protein insertion efficiency factor YidD [Clostridia bacterium]|nr:membrane protein insertion efficiency factor YidD [Clostridia bacterium]